MAAAAVKPTAAVDERTRRAQYEIVQRGDGTLRIVTRHQREQKEQRIAQEIAALLDQLRCRLSQLDQKIVSEKS